VVVSVLFSFFVAQQSPVVHPPTDTKRSDGSARRSVERVPVQQDRHHGEESDHPGEKKPARVSVFLKPVKRVKVL
jgi:hypothetical protein